MYWMYGMCNALWINGMSSCQEPECFRKEQGNQRCYSTETCIGLEGTMAFAKHETFYIREGWLFKGMAAIKKAEGVGRLPTIFLDDNAPEVLGIGHNMVRALRFWMQATGLAEEKLEDRQRVQRLTPFGEQVWNYDR